MTVKFEYTEKAEHFSSPDDDIPWVRHVFRDTDGRRCTIFYTVSSKNQATVLIDALNHSKKS